MQAMTGSESAPLAYAVDQPFSLFKDTTEERKHMASKQQKNVTLVTESTVEPANVEPTPVDTREDGDELARLTAQHKVDAARMKELRAAAKAAKPAKEPKQEKTLATIEAEQATHLSADTARLARRVAVRTAAGQSREDAIAAVMQDHAAAILGTLQLFDTGQYPSLEHALDAYTAQHAPKTIKVARAAKPSAE